MTGPSRPIRRACLPEDALDRRDTRRPRHRPAIAPGLVRAERDRGRGALHRSRAARARAPPPRACCGIDQPRHQARHARDDVDRRKVAALREPAIEHDVAVDEAAHLVGDRLVHVVARDEHRVDRGDRARARVAPARSTSRGSSANTLGG